MSVVLPTNYCDLEPTRSSCNYDVGSPGFYNGTVQYEQYGYNVDKTASLVFVALFGLATLIFLGLTLASRRWWLLYTVLLFGIGETLGWVGRLWSAYSTTWMPELGGYWGSNHTAFMIQIAVLIISPAFAAAGNYLLLKRIAPIMGIKYLFIHPFSYTLIFITGDIISLVVQALGGGIAASASTTAEANNGANIMVAGVFVQLVVMVGYTIVLLSFIARYYLNKPVSKPIELFRWWPNALRTKSNKKNQSQNGGISLENRIQIQKAGLRTPSSEESDTEMEQASRMGGRDGGGNLTQRDLGNHTEKEFRGARVMLGLCCSTTLLIFIRSIYRSIELLDGWTGPIIENQPLFDAMDGAMMLACLWLYTILHPMFFLPRMSGKGDA